MKVKELLERLATLPEDMNVEVEIMTGDFSTSIPASGLIIAEEPDEGEPYVAVVCEYSEVERIEDDYIRATFKS